MTKERKDLSTANPDSDPIAPSPSTSNVTAASLQTVSMSATYMAYSGQLPHPGMLAHYEGIVPGAAKQILDQALKQTDHRIEMESTYLRSTIATRSAGQWMAFGIAMGVLIVAYHCVSVSQPVLGLAAVISALAALAGVFIYAEKSGRRERTEKASIMAPKPPSELPPGSRKE